MYYDTDTTDRAHLCLTEVVIEETHKRYVERSKLHYSPAPTRQAPETAQLPNRTSSFIYTNTQGCYKQLPADKFGVHLKG